MVTLNGCFSFQDSVPTRVGCVVLEAITFDEDQLSVF